jgi:hypothetical protein
VKRGFSPLDRQLGLVRHSWTPQTLEHALRLAVEIPSYRRAAESFTALTQVPLSKSSLANLVVEYGGALVAQQAAEAEAVVRMPSRETTICPREEPQPEAERMAVALDGVMVHVREEGWKEAKVAAFSVVEVTPAEGDDAPQVQLTRHSYRAGLWDAVQFAKQQGAEGYRRGLEQVKQIIAIGDAAAWIWSIIVSWYAPCVQIIDWWHALQRVWTIAVAVCGEGTTETQAWFGTLQACLWAGNVRALLHALRAKWRRGKVMPEELRQAVGYLYRQRQRMHYQTYRQQGYPIGSGSVESACKVVVQERLVQAGMRWSRVGLQALLALRCALLSGRWESTWRMLTPALVT